MSFLVSYQNLGSQKALLIQTSALSRYSHLVSHTLSVTPLEIGCRGSLFIMSPAPLQIMVSQFIEQYIEHLVSLSRHLSSKFSRRLGEGEVKKPDSPLIDLIVCRSRLFTLTCTESISLSRPAICG